MSKRARAVDAIRLESVSKTYGVGEGRIRAQHNVTLGIAEEESSAVVGPSG